MGFFDDKLSSKQRKWIRFSYEMGLSIMLVIALKYGNMAFDEGAKLCNEARQEWGKQFGIDGIINFTIDVNESILIPMNYVELENQNCTCT